MWVGKRRGGGKDGAERMGRVRKRRVRRRWRRWQSRRRRRWREGGVVLSVERVEGERIGVAEWVRKTCWEGEEKLMMN